MAVATVQLLTVVLLHFTLLCWCQGRAEQRYSEALFMKFLADGRVSATFDFSTVWSVHPLRFSNPGNGESVNYGVTCCINIYVALMHIKGD